MKDTEIREVADSVLARFFKGTSFRKAEVRTEYAFDGAPYVQVDAHFEHWPKYDISNRVGAMDAIQVRLFEQDDNRLVAMTFYADDDPIIDDTDNDELDADNGTNSR